MAEERIIRSQSSVTLTISGALVSVRSLMEATKLFGPNPEGESYHFYSSSSLLATLETLETWAFVVVSFFFPLVSCIRKGKLF